MNFLEIKTSKSLYSEEGG